MKKSAGTIEEAKELMRGRLDFLDITKEREEELLMRANQDYKMIIDTFGKLGAEMLSALAIFISTVMLKEKGELMAIDYLVYREFLLTVGNSRLKTVDEIKDNHLNDTVHVIMEYILEQSDWMECPVQSKADEEDEDPIYLLTPSAEFLMMIKENATTLIGLELPLFKGSQLTNVDVLHIQETDEFKIELSFKTEDRVIKECFPINSIAELISITFDYNQTVVKNVMTVKLATMFAEVMVKNLMELNENKKLKENE